MRSEGSTIYDLRFTNFMGDEFFERPVVWLCAACVAVAVLLARCGAIEEYDPYAGCPAEDADGYAMEVYEEEMVGNSLPPCGE